MFTRATKAQAKLRMAVYGPPGSGKTFTSLRLGCRLAQHVPGGSGRVAVIDSERGSSEKYSNLFTFDRHLLGMDPRDQTPFHPSRYEAAVVAAVQAGYHVLIIDSLSHAWRGRGGVLEHVDTLAARRKGNSFVAWGGVDGGTAVQNHLIDVILSAPLHVIVTMRSKVEYVVETGLSGQAKPRRVGTAPVQRDDVEYEFDVVGDMDTASTMTVLKSRAVSLSGRVIPQPGEALADEIAAWLADGAPAPAAAHCYALEAGKFAMALGLTPEQLLDGCQSYYGTRDIGALRPDQYNDLLTRLRAALAARQQV